MGIRKSKENNLALLAKTAWRYINNEDLLCTKIIKAKYCLINKSLFGRPSLIQVTLGFVNAITVINDHVGWAIGHGKDISVRDSRWIPCDYGLRKPLSQIFNPNIKIKDLLHDNKS